MTGVDIPIPELQTVIHQPSILEISYLGEKEFFTGLQLICINKAMYIEDESLLENTTNFQLFMTMVNEKQLADKKATVLSTLQLFFPGAQCYFTPQSILLIRDGQNIMIDEETFGVLQNIISEICCLQSGDQSNFNPANDKAKEIAAKLMRGRKRVAEQKQEQGSIFTQYLSILVVGLHSMSLQNAIGLTIYQIYDLMERYKLFTSWDVDLRARMAGAKGDKPLEDWMKQIH